MSIFDQRTAKVLATICAFVAIGAFLYGVRHTLIVILFAVLFAYLLEPVVYRIERSRLARGSRWLAILETYLAIGAIVAGLGILFGPKLVEDARLLSQSLPGLLEKVTTRKDRLAIWQSVRLELRHSAQNRAVYCGASDRDSRLEWAGRYSGCQGVAEFDLGCSDPHSRYLFLARRTAVLRNLAAHLWRGQPAAISALDHDRS